MSVEFVKEQEGIGYVRQAYKQQKQLSYFTQSEIQHDVTTEYLRQWSQRNYAGTDYFLTWVKQIFRQQNFISFFKYMRKPLPSAKLINDEIKPQLKRVYFADDSYFKYSIRNKEVECPDDLKNETFENLLFNSLLFNHNDILVHDLNDINSAYRELLCINDVVAIDSDDSIIEKIAYKAEVKINGIEVEGYLYMDDSVFIFYDKNYNELSNISHDLKRCPACWISNEAFSTENDIVRKSIFSYVREELEEYVFLKTLLKMTEPNGAIPITVKLKTKTNSLEGSDFKGINSQEPMSSNELGSQKAEYGKDTNSSNGSIMQAGSVIEIPQIKKADQSIDTDLIQNFAKFFYIPVECLDYLNKRIQEIERSIIANVLGDYQQNNDAAKNETQINSSTHNKQDKLRAISMNLSWVRNQSDLMLLGLQYGIENVGVSLFYGSDFFLDNETELFNLFQKAPNPIERRNLLLRIGKTKYRFNKGRAERETILYTLLPYASDTDFDKALSQNLVDNTTKQLQLRFNYWISLFEARFGDISVFYNNLKASNSEKIIMINNLLIDLIDEMVIVPKQLNN